MRHQFLAAFIRIQHLQSPQPTHVWASFRCKTWKNSENELSLVTIRWIMWNNIGHFLRSALHWGCVPLSTIIVSLLWIRVGCFYAAMNFFNAIAAVCVCVFWCLLFICSKQWIERRRRDPMSLVPMPMAPALPNSSCKFSRPMFANRKAQQQPRQHRASAKKKKMFSWKMTTTMRNELRRQRAPNFAAKLGDIFPLNFVYFICISLFYSPSSSSSRFFVHSVCVGTSNGHSPTQSTHIEFDTWLTPSPQFLFSFSRLHLLVWWIRFSFSLRPLTLHAVEYVLMGPSMLLNVSLHFDNK